MPIELASDWQTAQVSESCWWAGFNGPLFSLEDVLDSDVLDSAVLEEW